MYSKTMASSRYSSSSITAVSRSRTTLTAPRTASSISISAAILRSRSRAFLSILSTTRVFVLRSSASNTAPNLPSPMRCPTTKCEPSVHVGLNNCLGLYLPSR
eukprot:Amastigsp_a844620_13.p4 type:complete len:103 gc:universal Amastigsp_a844620_13:419-727(+)